MVYRSLGKPGIEKGVFFVDRGGVRFYMDKEMMLSWLIGAKKAARSDKRSRILAKEGIAVEEGSESALSTAIERMVF